MNKILLIFCLLLSVFCFAQDKSNSNTQNPSGTKGTESMVAGKVVPAAQASSHTLPNVDIKTMNGENTSTSLFENGGKPIVIDFWATWCKPCIEELNAIHDVYADWQKSTGVKVIAISLDDARTMQRVAPFVNGKGWTYESYIDPNGDFKRAMSVNMPPHTFVLNAKKEIVWQHVGFSEGNEEEILEAVKKAIK